MRRPNTSICLFVALLLTSPTLANTQADPPAPSGSGAARSDPETRPESDSPSLPDAEQPPARKLSRSEICEMIESAASKEALPLPFFAKLIWRESRFNPKAVSPAGALGIAQFMPRTANGRGLADPFDPLPALLESAEMLRELIRQFGNLGLAAAAYNAGPKRVQDWLAKRGILKRETHDYVEVITGHSPAVWAAESPAAEQVIPQDFRCAEITKFVREVRKPPPVVASTEHPTPARNPARNRLLNKDAARKPGAVDLAGKRETQRSRDARGGTAAPAAKPAKMAELRRKAADQKRHGDKRAGREQMAQNRAGVKPVAGSTERGEPQRSAARNRLLNKDAARKPGAADLAGKRETQRGRDARGGNAAPSAKAAKMAELRRKAPDQKRHGEKQTARKQMAEHRAGAKPTAVSAQSRRKLVELSDRRAGSSTRRSRTAANTRDGEKACTKGAGRKVCRDA
jgi:Transglycosylase SLT domain